MDLPELDITKKLNKILLALEAQAKEDCPVDTGHLRNSIRSEMTSAKEGVVETNVEYAKHVEYGTSKQVAQPFMRTAIIKSEAKIKKILEDDNV